MDSEKFPLYVEYEIPPGSDTLEQHVADRLTGQTTTAHDMLYGQADSSAAPNIESVPDAAAVYLVHEDGSVVLGGIAIEDEGLVWSHEEFDIEAVRESFFGG